MIKVKLYIYAHFYEYSGKVHAADLQTVGYPRQWAGTRLGPVPLTVVGMQIEDTYP
jgi:hypothetical protein